MPFVVRYIDDPHPSAMGSSFRYLAVTNAGEWGTTPTKARATHFRTKREAEKTIAVFIIGRPEFRLASAQNARKHFLLESLDEITGERHKKQPRTLWARILTDDD